MNEAVGDSRNFVIATCGRGRHTRVRGIFASTSLPRPLPPQSTGQRRAPRPSPAQSCSRRKRRQRTRPTRQKGHISSRRRQLCPDPDGCAGGECPTAALPPSAELMLVTRTDRTGPRVNVLPERSRRGRGRLVNERAPPSSSVDSSLPRRDRGRARGSVHAPPVATGSRSGNVAGVAPIVAGRGDSASLGVGPD